jgi:hypothetical protein
VPRGEKFQIRGKLGRLIGYNDDASWRIYLYGSEKIISSKDVTFFEGQRLEDIILPNGSDLHDFLRQQNYDNEMLLPREIFSVERNTKTLQPGGARAAAPQGVELIGEPEYDSEDDQSEDVAEDVIDPDDLENGLPEVQPVPVPLLEQPIDSNLPRGSRTRAAPKRAPAEGYTAHLKVIDIDNSMKELGLNRCTRRRLAKQLKDFPHDTIAAFLSSLHDEDPAQANDSDPSSYKAAMKTAHAKEWRMACETEVKSLEGMSTWLLVDRKTLPDGTNILKGRWVLKRKYDADGDQSRFKGRWVCKGFGQKEGIDYDETYAPVVKPATLRVLLAIVVHYNLECKQFDIVTAFLNALIEDHLKIYVEMPHGFEVNGKVCLLKRALYGLKQSPLLWYEELAKYLCEMGFEALENDMCVFRHAKNGTTIVIYVDDMLVIARNLEKLEDAVQPLRTKFKMRELGDLHYYLGLRFVRDKANRTLCITQDAYFNKLAAKYSIDITKPGPAIPVNVR